MINLQIRKPASIQGLFIGFYSIHPLNQPDKSPHLSGNGFITGDNPNSFSKFLNEPSSFQLPGFTNGIYYRINEDGAQLKSGVSSTAFNWKTGSKNGYLHRGKPVGRNMTTVF